MSIEKAYNSWSEIYDNNENKTRDLDQVATQETLTNYEFNHVLELGCGTGKNTAWFVTKASQITALDFSEGMLTQAKQKITQSNIEFKQADLNQLWPVTGDTFDLASCNLVLEHIKNLDHIFSQAYEKLKAGGKFFICELHPFKQYTGSKARYETENGTEELEVYIHHFSDFIGHAEKNGFNLVTANEWFDEEDKNSIPRLVSFVFEK